MSFRITGLDPQPFLPLYGLDARELAARGVERHPVDRHPGFPDRIALVDAQPGDAVLLLNYTHQPAPTPYRASHAIFVLEGATERYDRVDEVPRVLRRRTISLRAFDDTHRMVDAALVEGGELAATIAAQLATPAVAYLQAHYALRGCYAARIERA